MLEAVYFTGCNK